MFSNQMKCLLTVGAVCLLLVGCGEDKDPGTPIEDAMRKSSPSGMPMGMPTGMAPGMPGGLPTGMPGPDMLTKAASIKLTDEMMERYVKVLGELQNVKSPGAALLARYKFNTQEWTSLSLIIGGSYVRTSMAGSRPALEKQLAGLKTQLAEAGAEDKPMIEARLRALEAQMKAVEGFGQATEIDNHNMQELERWKDRVKAARSR